MGIRLGAITEWASSLLGSYKIPFTTGSLTRLVRMDTLADWVLKTYTGFLQSGTGAVPTPVQDELRALGARPEQFGAAGDGSTDDNVALQKWLTKGGKLYLPAGKTYKNTAANLTGVANTEIYLAAGSVLLLNTTRLSFLSVNNVRIYGPGKIQSTSMNTSDSLPTNWQGRGIVEFGGSAATLATDFQIEGVEVQGEWTTGTPSGTGNTKKRGIYVVNTSRALVEGCHVHNIVGEAICYEDGNGAAGIDARIIGNTIHDCDFNAYNFNTLTSINTVCSGNTAYNVYNGFEGGCGIISNNTFDTLANMGIGAGASSKCPGDMNVIGNTIRNATGLGISLTYNAGTAGVVSVVGNTINGAGDNGITVGITTVICEVIVAGNTVRNYGTGGTTNRRGISVSGTSGGYVGGNVISTPAANGQYGLDIATSSSTKTLTLGPNAVDTAGTQPYNALQSNSGAGAEQQLYYGHVFPVSVTGVCGRDIVLEENDARQIPVRCWRLQSHRHRNRSRHEQYQDVQAEMGRHDDLHTRRSGRGSKLMAD
jgi:hypothetical protein